MERETIIVLAAAAVVLAVVLALLLSRLGRLRRSLESRDRELAEARRDASAKDLTINSLQKDLSHKEEEVAGARKLYDERLAELREYNEKSLQEQLKAVKAQISAESRQGSLPERL